MNDDYRNPHLILVEGRAFMAVDATNGAPLSQFPTNQTWRASLVTYMFGNKQYVKELISVT
jgi:hypothetical protein